MPTREGLNKHWKEVEAFKNGSDLEILGLHPNEEWVDCGVPSFSVARTYRVKPDPPVMPRINWDHVNPRFKYLAVDADGAGWLYTNQPKADAKNKDWAPSSDDLRPLDIAEANALSSFRAGNAPWRESLIARPGTIIEAVFEGK